VAAHWLVHVYRVQRGGVEAGQPHVPHEHDPERIGGAPESNLLGPSRQSVTPAPAPQEDITGGLQFVLRNAKVAFLSRLPGSFD
jgi:hypothetical protein